MLFGIGRLFYSLSVSLLKIGEAYPRHKNKLTASTIKNVHPCSFFTCEICISQISFLIRTIAIRAENDTLRIYCSSGMDAAGLNRSDVSAMLKLAAKSVQGCTLLARWRRRCPHIFERKGLTKLYRCWILKLWTSQIFLPQQEWLQLLFLFVSIIFRVM